MLTSTFRNVSTVSNCSRRANISVNRSSLAFRSSRPMNTMVLNKNKNKKITPLLKTTLPTSFSKTFVRLHHDDASETHVAQVGAQAPDFTATAVVGSQFKEIKLSDYKGKYVVFFWYPLDFTFVCPTEIIEFSEKAKEFQKIGTEVIGASCDSHFTHLAWINTPRKEGGLGALHIPLVADFSKEIAKKYGALLANKPFAARATYIIDPKGVIRHISVNDPPVGRNVEEVLRLVQGYQYTDKHGEVCPANWKPGNDTMIPDPVKSKAYFSKHGN